MSYFNLKFNP